MESVIGSCDDRMKKAIGALEAEYSGLRTGRASAALLDRIRVDAYGQKTPLSQVASISVPEARLLVIQPWDKGIMSEIEKAIRSSDLGVNPSSDGKVIRISIPPLTQERRKELVKKAKNDAEQARVAIRNIRRDGNEDVKKRLKDAGITEDDAAKAEQELQKITDAAISRINKIFEDKEKEILEV